MKQIVLEVLEQITKEKREAKVDPDFVLDLELKKELWKRLNVVLHELRKEKKLRIGNTLNRKFIELIENEK